MASDDDKPDKIEFHAEAINNSKIDLVGGNKVHATDGSIAAGRDLHIHLPPGSEIRAADILNRPTALDPQTALHKYLKDLIGRTHHLSLQGIVSDGQQAQIPLDQIYITLTTTEERTREAEAAHLETAAQQALGMSHRPHLHQERPLTETVTISINDALRKHNRLVILGDPGSGKTTLLRYLALTYATSLFVDGSQTIVNQRLELEGEDGRLPILIYLRDFAPYFNNFNNGGRPPGPKQLLDYLHKSYADKMINLPADFFTQRMQTGQAVVFLDGMDEIVDEGWRGRMAKLIDDLTLAYPACRFVVSSRIKGYISGARLEQEYQTTTIKDFSLADVAQFLGRWHYWNAHFKGIEARKAQMIAQSDTSALLDTLRQRPRLAQLAINPLMLTVIALVNQEYTLSNSRAKLYMQAVDILLEQWDEKQKQLEKTPLLPGHNVVKKEVLQLVALHMHEQTKLVGEGEVAQAPEIEQTELEELLDRYFKTQMPEATTAVIQTKRDQFINLIEQRTGLLIAREEEVYAFSHLTFQEFLAARAILDMPQEEYVDYILARVGETWWREVILLAAGVLNVKSKRRMTRLVQAIADQPSEPDPFHNLVLAAECLHDVGEEEADNVLLNGIYDQLEAAFLKPQVPFWKRLTFRDSMGEQRRIAANALSLLAPYRKNQQYWSLPYGEPEWVEIPAGPFMIGDGRRTVDLDTFDIAKVPVTNAQYALFVADKPHPAPEHWEDGRIPRGLETHPVVHVSWYDALAYCAWLSEKTEEEITLPTEEQWEKAARGTDGRTYPWGDRFDPLLCNSLELGLDQTTPVALFEEGVSYYGVLDMSGNVWEWCLNKYGNPEVTDNDGSDDWRVLHGGSWLGGGRYARAADRNYGHPYGRVSRYGFRVCRRPPSL